MMDSRSELQKVLEGVDDRLTVYYQPPSNITLQYPCIVYQLSRVRRVMGNNKVYHLRRSYTLLLITKGLNDDLIDKLLQLPYVRHDRSYRANNLQHESFTINY